MSDRELLKQPPGRSTATASATPSTSTAALVPGKRTLVEQLMPPSVPGMSAPPAARAPQASQDSGGLELHLLPAAESMLTLFGPREAPAAANDVPAEQAAAALPAAPANDAPLPSAPAHDEPAHTDPADAHADAPGAQADPAKAAPLPEGGPQAATAAGDAIATMVTAADKSPAAGAAPEAHGAAAGSVGAGGSDEFAGTAPGKDKSKDNWVRYGGKNNPNATHGYDVGGAHKVKHAGGEKSAAVYAVSSVEGTYDNVQTYDSAVLTFGILQWTVHAGSLQRFLGYLKYESGADARAAFDDHLGKNGVDIRREGKEYQLFYRGERHKGAEDFDRLIRASQDTARMWVDWFHGLGLDPRAQKAQFDYAKDQYDRVQKTALTEHVVDASLKKCAKTFHAQNRGAYGTVSDWTSASPKAALLYFSMADNNPSYANAALLKAIDAFYSSQGKDKAKWPKDWPEQFASVFEARCRETLSTWGDHGGSEGRVSKTLRFWNQAHQHPAEAPDAAVAEAPAHAAAPAHAEAHHDAHRARAAARAVAVKTRAEHAPTVHAAHAAPAPHGDSFADLAVHYAEALAHSVEAQAQASQQASQQLAQQMASMLSGSRGNAAAGHATESSAHPSHGHDQADEAHGPQLEHGDGPKAPDKVASHSGVKTVGREVYAAGGVLSREHLGQKGLSDAEFEFKKRVWDQLVARVGDAVYGGVAKDHLQNFEGHPFRDDMVAPLQSLLTAMRAALKSGGEVNGVKPGHATNVRVASGYRTPEHELDLWDGYFQKYMTKTAKARAGTKDKPLDPLGPEAVTYMVHYVGSRKALPGKSKHTNGTAVDLQMEMNGALLPNDYDDQADWHASWHFAWLKANAASYGFKNYIKEAWHWELKG